MTDRKVAHHFEHLDSTNAEALRQLRREKPPPEWTLIHADYQTAGRGQGSNGWFSSAGKNLLFSVIHYPELLAVDLFRLTQVHSLSLAASLDGLMENLSPPAGKITPATTGIRVKWPNDIYCNGRKIAGLLIQNGFQGSRVQWSVLGVGLNVNETEFPPALRGRAGSLLELSDRGIPFDRDRCLDHIFATLKSNYQYFIAEGRSGELNDRYHELLYRRGEVHPFRRPPNGPVFPATLLGAAPDGRLRLRHADGTTELFDLKNIVFA